MKIKFSPLTHLTPAVLGNGQFRLSITGDFGPDYTLQASTNLTTWKNLLVTNSPVLPLNWSDTNAGGLLYRFDRVLMRP